MNSVVVVCCSDITLCKFMGDVKDARRRPKTKGRRLAYLTRMPDPIVDREHRQSANCLGPWRSRCSHASRSSPRPARTLVCASLYADTPRVHPLSTSQMQTSTVLATQTLQGPYLAMFDGQFTRTKLGLSSGVGRVKRRHFSR
jgi:hypothetical protein